MQPSPAPSPVRIGTAGWSIPKTDAAAFPAEGSHLQRYSAVLSAVEINSSFHRPHRRQTYERWAATVPADFRFSVKIPKTISHAARLIDTEPLLDAFVAEVAGLGGKLAVLLLQLPPSFGYDERVVARFFEALRHRIPPTVQLACEPRHASWFAPDVEVWLAMQRVARVAADPVIAPGGAQPGGWPGLRYHRLHGAPRIYYSSYEAAFLEALAITLAGDTPAWCIFDNTASGAATGNALALQTMLMPG
ncbi:DUF72 domain-containing protein [Sphingomonas qilianensis]|uniref:DUF72 domain-containing protein n=1 Tax=Sphingomonas qilianensis TaxID=1736690 RepID=A0ABU9XWF3_9SPHN